MKRTFLSLVGLLVAMLTMAGPVSLQQAQQRAQQFLGQRGAAPTSGSMRLAKKQTKLEQATSASADAYYYVFNVGEQQGFVIVSGDDRTEEILGYADSGSFSEENMPDNMRAWLEGYQDQMRWMDEHNYQPSNTAPKRLSGSTIDPLLSTTWDQDAPYNNACPSDAGGRCVTGCVATAMAQVIAYHGKKSGNEEGYLTDDIPGYIRSNIEYEGVPKEGTVFKWKKMLNSYAGSYTDEEAAAVATLMHACGVSVLMNYGSGSSGTDSRYVAPALRNYFGCNATYVSRDSYSYDGWQQLIYDELSNDRPVYYSGATSSSGHAFVIDGYSGNGLFHVNWGWSGNSNGDFVLSVLNPHNTTSIGASSVDEGYSYEQAAVINVGFSETPSAGALQLTFSNLGVSGNNITFAAINETGQTASFDFGIGYYDNNVLNPISLSYFEDLPNLYGNSALSLPVSGLSNGTYRIVCMSREHDDSKPWIVAQSSDYNYVVAEVSGSNIALTLHPVSVLSVTKFTHPSTNSYFANDEQTVQATIKNSGEEFFGDLYFFASTSQSSMGSDKGKAIAVVESNASTSLSFGFTPDSEGTWYYWVATDKSGSNVIGSGSVEISLNPHQLTGNFVYSSVAITDADETSWRVDNNGSKWVDVFNSTRAIEMTVTVKNVTNSNFEIGVGVLKFNLQQYKNNVWTSVATYQNADALTINAGKTLTFGAMSFGNRDYGIYRIRLLQNDDVQDDRYCFNTALDKIPSFSADGEGENFLLTTTDVELPADMAVADLTELDLNTFTVTPSTNPNCLYLLANGASVPTALNGKNVVVGSEAAQINIVDNGTNGFYSPIAFTVTDKISYKRTFSKGYSSDGKGWSTISLPFSVTKVTTTNPDDSERVLDWCHSTDDTGKNFYLMAFTSDDGSGVAFSHANTFEANTPYIIAVAGPEFGDKWNLVNKELEFSATNAAVPATTEIVSSCSNYQFFGTLATTAAASIYKLNDDGNLFQLTNATELPFRAYFTAKGGNGDVSSLGIGFGNGTSTGIGPAIISTPNADLQGVYTLSGVKVAEGGSLDNLPAGIYVINGKKVVK